MVEKILTTEFSSAGGLRLIARLGRGKSRGREQGADAEKNDLRVTCHE